MGKKIKILMATVVFVFVMVGGYFFISSKITPETVRSQLEEHLEHLFPGGNITVGEVSYSLGFSAHVDIEKIEGSLGDQPFFSLENISVSIPIFSILAGGGGINISVTSPAFYYTKEGQSSNWDQALGSNSLQEQKGVNPVRREGNQEVEGLRESLLALPIFLKESILNVDLRKLSVVYVEENKKNEVIVDKLLLKEVGINSFLSFELDSLFHIPLGEGKGLKFRFVSIGEMKIREFFENKALPVSVIVKMSDIVADGMPYNLDEIQSKIDLVLEDKEGIEGSAEVTYRETNSLGFQFRVKEEETLVDGISSSFLVKDLMEVTATNVLGLDVDETVLSLEGSFSLRGSRIEPNMKVNVATPGIRYVSGGIETHSVLSAEVTGEDVLVTTETNMLGGAIVSETRAKINRDILRQGMAALADMNSNVNVNNVKLEETILRTFFVSKAPKVKNTSPTEMGKEISTGDEVGQVFSLPPARVKIMFNDNSLGGSKIGGTLGVRSTGNRLDLEKSSVVNIDRGSLGLSGSARPRAEGMDLRFAMNVKNVNAKSFEAFLPQYVGGVAGVFSGSVSGTATHRGGVNKYDVSLKMAARDGVIQKMEISDSLGGLVESLPFNMGEKIKDKSIRVNPGFSLFRLNARLRDSHYRLQEIYFLGQKDRAEIKGQGDIYPLEDKRGEVMLHYRDGTGKFDSLLKDVGSETLPLKFSGMGRSLRPDYDYTIKRLGERYVKNKGKAKVEKVIKDKVKEVLQGDKLKGFLDGLL